MAETEQCVAKQQHTVPGIVLEFRVVCCKATTHYSTWKVFGDRLGWNNASLFTIAVVVCEIPTPTLTLFTCPIMHFLLSIRYGSRLELLDIVYYIATIDPYV